MPVMVPHPVRRVDTVNKPATAEAIRRTAKFFIDTFLIEERFYAVPMQFAWFFLLSSNACVCLMADKHRRHERKERIEALTVRDVRE